MQRGDRDCQLINHGSVDLRRNNAKLIIVDLLDTADVGSGFTGLDTDCISLVIIHEIGKSCSCILGLGKSCKIAFIALDHHIPEILCRSLILKCEAPVCSACRNTVVFLVVAAALAEINNALCESLAGLVDIFPESSLLLFCPVSEICIILSGSCQKVEQCVHTGTILGKTLDRL